MGMWKRLLEEYCEAMHPGDYDAQDQLFEKVMFGEVSPAYEEMLEVIRRHQESQNADDPDPQS